MRIAQENLFGPVCFMFKWSNEDEMIAAANDVDYGWTGCIFTDDLRRAHRVSEALEAGYVGINDAGPHYLGAPFGGWKQSGDGQEEALREIFEFTQTKDINIRSTLNRPRLVLYSPPIISWVTIIVIDTDLGSSLLDSTHKGPKLH